MLIIAIFLLSLSGCGYKASPYYKEKAPDADNNVKFIIKDKNFDNNESCN
jgi:predicted small lipoprotein YifL